MDEYIASLDTAAQAGLYTDIMTTPTDDYLDSAVQQAMSELTREDIEGMMLEGYAEEMGVDAEAVRDYVSQMDDETLMGYVEEMAREAIAEPVRRGRARPALRHEPAAAGHGPHHGPALRLAVRVCL